jgi:hypothetical protein
MVIGDKPESTAKCLLHWCFVHPKPHVGCMTKTGSTQPTTEFAGEKMTSLSCYVFSIPSPCNGKLLLNYRVCFDRFNF